MLTVHSFNSAKHTPAKYKQSAQILPNYSNKAIFTRNNITMYVLILRTVCSAKLCVPKIKLHYYKFLPVTGAPVIGNVHFLL